jgi:hypothetical protein
MSSDPYAINDDGIPKDAAAFRDALKADPKKLKALEQEPEVLKIVMGDDINAFQELIKSVYVVSKVLFLRAWVGSSNEKIKNTPIICNLCAG